MDIRKFFGGKAAASPQSKSKEQNSNEDKVKVSKKRSRKNVLSDSEEEDQEKFVKAKKSKGTSQDKKSDRKAVDPNDFFSKTPIKNKAKKEKKETPKSKSKPCNKKEEKPQVFQLSDSSDDNDDFSFDLQPAEKKVEKEKKLMEKPIQKSSSSKTNGKQDKPRAFQLSDNSNDDLPFDSKPKKLEKKTLSGKLSKAKASSATSADVKNKERQIGEKTAIKSKEALKKQHKTPEKVKEEKVKTQKKKKQAEEENKPGKVKEEPNTPDKIKKEPKTPKSSKQKDIVPKTPDEEVKDAQAAKRERFLKFKQYRDKLASGPVNPGCKEIPKGADNCMEGITFVVTGIQESLGRDEIKSLVERYGGKVTSAVSGRTSYLITGVEAGESKTKKANQLGTKIITEDDFLELIRTLPGKKSKYDVVADDVKTPTKSKGAVSKRPSQSKPSKSPKKSEVTPKKRKEDKDEDGLEVKPKFKAVKQKEEKHDDVEHLMWVDKYKPSKISQIIGQQGAQSNMNKLKRWLEKWHYNNTDPVGKTKVKPSWGGSFNNDPTGASFKAALLAGPPGVGKTTTATLVCQELGFSYIELNASDRRSKKSLNEEVAEYLHSSSLTSAFNSVKGKATNKKHVLLMDEVDGMAGNEDRGGMRELINLLKTTKIPIICMCNDRTSTKMRSFINYCFDLRFQRPRVEQITGAVMSICFKEKLQIPAPAVQALIRGCNQDIRQILHNLSLIKKKNSNFSYDDVEKHNKNSNKDLNLGLFEVARKLLTAEAAQLSVIDKLNHFFMDYSMIPNFVQENYLNITPFAAKGDVYKDLLVKSKSADAIALGDMIDSNIRKNQAWSLLPTFGMVSTVLPCTYNCGNIRARINFPTAFGKMSTTSKNRRLLNELSFHSSVATGGSSEQRFNLDYLPYLKYHATQPLIDQSRGGANGIGRSMQLLEEYDLTKDDLNNVMDVGTFSGSVNPFTQVDSKVKAAFTRMYNKESHALPYTQALPTVGKKRKAAAADAEDGVEVDPVNQVSDDEAEVDLSKLAKTKKKPTKSKAASSTKSTAASKKRAKKN